MEPERDETRMRAIEWHIRLRDGDGDAWDAFSDWLAQDPRHGDAYDRIEASDRAITPLLPGVVFREAANDGDGAEAEAMRPPRTRRWVTGGLLAAASLATLLLALPSIQADRYRIQTAAGERRTVTLDAGTRVVMNGGTIMAFDRKDPRFASLESGEALFQVAHDEARPFTLHMGDDSVRDVGTIFNVVRATGGIRVAVREGKVVYNPDAQAVALNPGQALVAPAGSRDIRVEDLSADAVGAWEQGRLVYDGDPLSQVAADLERMLGIAIAVDPAIARRPVSGSIIVDGKGPDQVQRLEHALDIAITTGPAGWTIKAAPAASH
jgi:transmembrane sensor